MCPLHHCLSCCEMTQSHDETVDLEDWPIYSSGRESVGGLVAGERRTAVCSVEIQSRKKTDQESVSKPTQTGVNTL